jgi:hypothetical protein
MAAPQPKFRNTKGQKHFPDGKYLVYSEEVKINDVLGKDFYPNLEKSEVQIYDGLPPLGHWNEGKFNHVLYKETNEDAVGTDIMGNEV